MMSFYSHWNDQKNQQLVVQGMNASYWGWKPTAVVSFQLKHPTEKQQRMINLANFAMFPCHLDQLSILSFHRRGHVVVANHTHLAMFGGKAGKGQKFIWPYGTFGMTASQTLVFLLLSILRGFFVTDRQCNINIKTPDGLVWDVPYLVVNGRSCFKEETLIPSGEEVEILWFDFALIFLIAFIESIFYRYPFQIFILWRISQDYGPFKSAGNSLDNLWILEPSNLGWPFISMYEHWVHQCIPIIRFFFFFFREDIFISDLVNYFFLPFASLVI